MSIFEEADRALLPGFERRFVETDDGAMLTLGAGDGPPLLMIHGDPQTHLCWHHVVSDLAKRFRVILTDLRGRGESHKPDERAGVEAYSKRVMAAEQLAVMKALGHESFMLVGHDRGARVARRLALDHPEAVSRLVVMDIIPALDLYENLTAEIAQDYFYFSFLTQDHPVPERLIAGDAEGFTSLILNGLSDQVVDYDPQALEAYLASGSAPDAVHAMCQCFRAGFHIDRHHDQADRHAGRKIACPALVMWGAQGVVGRHFDVETIWNGWCDDATYQPMPSGHFIPEEAPLETRDALNAFLR
ncbi:MAG: alpha/beta hydrolase [Pseudomonadota bacterium]